MHTRSATWAGGWLILMLALAGCGDNPNVADVTGTVTYNGKEIEDGMITFISVDGKGDGGSNIVEGKYTAKRVPVGRTRVKITGSQIYAYKERYKDKPELKRPLTKNFVNAKFNEKSELEFEVQPGKNDKDWVLRD
jgi:hypothetical protein